MKFSFKSQKGIPGSSKEKDKEVPGAKRKEQLRQAQKTHRERKEAYIRSLEAEVVQLRANEARIIQETKSLYARINVLERLLTENRIQIPSSDQLTLAGGFSPSSVQSEGLFSVSIRGSGRGGKQKRIHIEKPATQFHSESSVTGSTISPTGLSSGDDVNLSNLGGASFSDVTSPFQTTSPKCLGELDTSAVGMEFVLTLENPCLGHVDTEQHAHADSNGHALTATAAILHHCPDAPGRRLESRQGWNYPVTGIEKLLELSANIPLDGEVTPVQAWDYLRRHPGFSGLEVTRLWTLAEKLLKHVKCYGFGGVIQQDVFENSVFEAFVVGRVF